MAKKEKDPAFQVRPQDQKLFDACRMLNYQQIIMEIQNGADVNALDRRHQMAVIDIIAEAACGPEYRNDSAMQENVLKIIAQLLAMGAKPDGVTDDATPLHKFSWVLYNWNICSKLLRAGAEINRVLGDRGTALDFVSDEIQFLENSDEGNRDADLRKLEHLYDQMVCRGALHYNELKEKKAQYCYEKTKKN